MSDRSKRKSANQPPVSAHPAFPVIVALWFAALFGIGSMVLPIDLFERFSVASGLAGIYEGAQPPLGATARIALAAIASLIGAGAGLFVARRVAIAHAPRTSGRRTAAFQSAPPEPERVKRPISAHEELFEGGLDAEDEPPARPAPALRRRSLAVTDESAPSDFLAFAPLPGRSANEADEPLDLVAFDQAQVAEEEPAAAEMAPHEFGSASLSQPMAMDAYRAPRQEPPAEVPVGHDTGAEAGDSDVPADVPPGSPETADSATPLAERALDELGVVELVERFALALQRHQDRIAARDEPVEETLVVREEALHRPLFAAEPESAVVDRAEGAPVVAPSGTLPAALRPFGFEDEEDESDVLPDLDLTAVLSIRRPPSLQAFESPSVAASEHSSGSEDENEDASEGEYSSLLAMKSPFGQRETVRIEDEDEALESEVEPIVVFPGQSIRRAAPAADGPARDAHAPARPFDAPLERIDRPAAAVQRPPLGDSGATERALREALEKLQKMSGAA